MNAIDVIAKHVLNRAGSSFFRGEIDAAIKDIDAPGQHYIVNFCPFHAGDKEPSLVVKKHSMRWYCFECRRIGDVEEVSVRGREIISRIRV